MTYRQIIENLLQECRNADNGIEHLDDSTHPELDDVTRKVMDGFMNVLNAAHQVRTTQNAYFKARKAKQDYDASKLLDESKKAEKIFDDLVKFWRVEMAPPPPPSPQMGIF